MNLSIGVKHQTNHNGLSSDSIRTVLIFAVPSRYTDYDEIEWSIAKQYNCSKIHPSSAVRDNTVTTLTGAFVFLVCFSGYLLIEYSHEPADVC